MLHAPFSPIGLHPAGLLKVLGNQVAQSMSLSLNQKEQLLQSQRVSASKPTFNKIHQESHLPGGGDHGSPRWG